MRRVHYLDRSALTPAEARFQQNLATAFQVQRDLAADRIDSDPDLDSRGVAILMSEAATLAADTLIQFGMSDAEVTEYVRVVLRHRRQTHEQAGTAEAVATHPAPEASS
jgi:hypothetical protein